MTDEREPEQPTAEQPAADDLPLDGGVEEGTSEQEPLADTPALEAESDVETFPEDEPETEPSAEGTETETETGETAAKSGRGWGIGSLTSRLRRSSTPEPAAEPAPPLDLSDRDTIPYPLPVAPTDDLETPDDAEAEAGEPNSDLQARRRHVQVSAHLVVLTAVATVVTLAFVLIEPSPRWLLLLGAMAVVLGLDGTLRQTWREPFASGQETAPFLFVPALYMLAVPVLIEHNIQGEFALLVGIAAGLGFGTLAWAEIASVRTNAAEYEQGRIIVTANTYLAGFAIFALSYVFDIDLPAAILAIALASTMLAVEVLREGEIDPVETLGFAVVTGVVMAEARWLLYYVPLDTYLAGLTLLLVFYFVTGLLHSHITRALNSVLAMQYGGIAAAGLALVVAARAVGLA